ncbi:RdgB/HAM1 family non-canonical purine NTP pyrophosphatase [Candidatus Omnitrophota bacterium]
MKRKRSIELVVASKNADKVKEIREILKGQNLKISCLRDYPQSPYILENGKTFRENAVKKAMIIAKFTQKLTLGEDSGLEVRALNGKPGVYSARFSGRDKSDLKNNLKLLRVLGDLPPTKRKARYVSAVALADNNGLIGVVEGYCAGSIGFQMRGCSGFGYDPLFVIAKYKKTFAQLGPLIKHRISHRFRALKKARSILSKHARGNFLTHSAI